MATTTERHIIEVGISGSDSAASELAALSAAARRAMKGISDALESLSAFKTIKIRVDTGDATRSVNRLRDQLQSTFRPLLGYTSESARNRSRGAQFGWRRRRHNALAYSRGQAEYLGALFGANFTGPGVPLLGMSDTENFTNSDLDKLYRLKNLKRKLNEHRERMRNAIIPYGGGGGSFIPPGGGDGGDSGSGFFYPTGGGGGGGGGGFAGRIAGFFRGIDLLARRIGVTIRLALLPYTALYKMAKKLMALFGVRENFKLYKDANMSGMLRGGDATGLLQQQRISTLLGGDAASISAMMGRIASERAMLAYGGKGGSFMEAARLFGVNIFGSGRYGFATNEEYLNNIAAAMGRLDPEGRIALARTAGLTSEQFWAMRGGTASWSKYTSSNSTLLERLIKSVEKADFWLGKQNERFRKATGNDLPFSSRLSDAFTSSGGAWHGEVVEEWNRSWGALKSTVSEFVLVLGDAVLPLLNTLCDFLSILIQMITAFISPFAKFISYVGRFINGFFNPGTWDSLFKNGTEAERAVDNTPQAIRLRRSDWDDTGNASGGGNRSISVNNVTINARSPSEARDFMQGMIDGVASSDYMNMENNGMSAVA